LGLSRPIAERWPILLPRHTYPLAVTATMLVGFSPLAVERLDDLLSVYALFSVFSHGRDPRPGS
jgi:hypothetical protein